MSGYIPAEFTFRQAVEHIINNRLQVVVAYISMIENTDNIESCRSYAKSAMASIEAMRDQLKTATDKLTKE